MVDYKAMDSADMVHECADSADKWATAFCQHWPGVDEEVMRGWFANAIEGSWDHRNGVIHNGDHATFLQAKMEDKAEK